MLKHIAITAAKARPKPYRIADGDGLYLSIETNGSKLWRFRYFFGGREKMLSLGAYPEVSLAAARGKRDDAKITLAGGTDPARKREQDKLAASIVAGNTFGAIAEEYIQRLIEKGSANITVSKNRWLLTNLASDLSKRPITAITPSEILVLLQRYERLGRRETARRLRTTIGSVFRFAILTLRATNDPTYALKGALLKPIVTHRPAITDERQLGALMVSIDEYTGWPTLKCAMQLLALTMVRPGEVRLMRKSEIIFPKALWMIPAERMKMRRPFEVPLSRQALAVIRQMWDVHPSNGLLFPSIRSSVKPLSENAMNSALRRMGFTQEEMCAHGFRASASTILNSRGFNADHIEAALAHQDEDDVRRAYNRSTYLPERVKLMQEWADLLDSFRKLKAAA